MPNKLRKRGKVLRISPLRKALSDKQLRRDVMYTRYCNKDCKECEEQSALAAKLNWLNRISISTEILPTGELEKGELVVISKDGNFIPKVMH